MKKLAALILALCMTVPVFTAFAADTALTVSGASEGVKTEGNIKLKADEYIKFSSVDFDKVKSVTITGEPNYTSHWNGDTFELRLDDKNGKLIGYIYMSPDGGNTFSVNVSETGTHDLYVGSVYGVAGSTAIKKVSVSDTAVPEKEAYVPVPDSALRDSYSDTWAATSGLGRHVADYAEVGPVKEGKAVGLFYWNWNTDEDTTVNIINNTEFKKEHPEAYAEDAYFNEAWPKGKTNYFHSEPLYGYYAGDDYWVYRRDAELLADVGIDFLFLDYTNGRVTFKKNLEAMLKALRDAKESGVNVPKVVFTCNLTSGVADTKYALKDLYLTLYKEGRYLDLWYYHEGKPLILAHEENLDVGLDANDPAEIALSDEMYDFFTFRGIESDWRREMTQKENKWSIAEKFPQRTFGVDSKGNPETVIAAAAENKSVETERLAPMSSAYVRGKNYTETYGFDLRPDAYLYNYCFEEKIAGALRTDAKILLISSWNEWTAVRNENYAGRFKNSFIDHFDEIGTRDLAISKNSNRDNGYMLMADAVRKWKGVRPAPAAGKETTIDLENPDSWNAVTPEFVSVKGVYDRDSVGYLKVKYENKTARNNIKTSKAARDKDYVYFMANTEIALTGEGTDNFMVLYLDSDRNHATGWEGYDFRVRKSAVEKYVNGVWTGCGTAEYKVSGTMYQLKIAKSVLAMGDKTDIEFKWADNSDDSDILNFYITGIAAPSGRFNYVFKDYEDKTTTEADRALLKTATVVKPGSNKAVINGGIMNVYEANTAYGVQYLDGSVYVPAAMLNDALGYGTTKVIYESDRRFLKIDTEERMVYTTVDSISAVSDGKDIYLSAPVKEIGGVIYVPVSMMGEAFGLEILNMGNAVAFGKNISPDAASRAAELI